MLRRTDVGRDINRHNYSGTELQEQLSRPVVEWLLALLRMRNSHAAFGGAFEMSPSPPDRLMLGWRNGGAWARVDADLSEMRATIICSGESPWSSL